MVLNLEETSEKGSCFELLYRSCGKFGMKGFFARSIMMGAIWLASGTMQRRFRPASTLGKPFQAMCGGTWYQVDPTRARHVEIELRCCGNSRRSEGHGGRRLEKWWLCLPPRFLFGFGECYSSGGRAPSHPYRGQSGPGERIHESGYWKWFPPYGLLDQRRLLCFSPEQQLGQGHPTEYADF